MMRLSKLSQCIIANDFGSRATLRRSEFSCGEVPFELPGRSRLNLLSQLTQQPCTRVTSGSHKNIQTKVFIFETSKYYLVYEILKYAAKIGVSFIMMSSRGSSNEFEELIAIRNLFPFMRAKWKQS